MTNCVSSPEAKPDCGSDIEIALNLVNLQIELLNNNLDFLETKLYKILNSNKVPLLEHPVREASQTPLQRDILKLEVELGAANDKMDTIMARIVL